MSIDYDRVFWRAALTMMDEKLEEHGIDSITEEQFDRLMEGMDAQREICRGELRQRLGMSVVPRIRMPW